MFTGIVTDVGRIRQIERRGDAHFTIDTAYDTASIEIGASLCLSGACLTVVDKGADWVAVDVSAETLGCTKLGDLDAGSPVNLERPLRVGDELGGHIVTGHVDGVGEVTDIAAEGDSLRLVIRAPDGLGRYLAPKGSITADGVSLTVNDVQGASFGVNIIPHTRAKTTFGSVGKGDRINLEVDILARYVARLVNGE